MTEEDNTKGDLDNLCGLAHTRLAIENSILKPDDFAKETEMAKTATSKKRKESGTKSLKAHVAFSSPELKNPKLVSEALLDCIRTGDLDSFRDVLAIYIMRANKAQFAKKAGIGRRTLYDILDPSRKFNPELSTVSSIIRALET